MMVTPVVTHVGNLKVANDLPKQALEEGYPLKEGMSLSIWLQGVRNNDLIDHRSTPELPNSADVVVIGSGLTGTLTAYELLHGPNPPSSIVLVEAREFCSGATGRNAGHCKPDQWRGFAQYSRVHGPEQALKILDNEQQTFDALVDFIHKNNVDCDLWTGETLDVAMTPEISKAATEVWEAVQNAGYKVDHIRYIDDKEEAVKVSRLKSAEKVWAWKAATLYPWKLTAHIAKMALAKGLNLQTWTTVGSVDASKETPGSWVVNTDRGTIQTPTVVYASNAYTPTIVPQFKNIINPQPFLCNRFIPPRSFSGSKGLKNSYGVLLPNSSLFSINPNSDGTGHVLLGGSNPGQEEMNEWLQNHPERMFDDGICRFPSVNNAAIKFTEEEFIGWADDIKGPGSGFQQSWTGVIGRSGDGVPFIGPRPGYPGQFCCVGHNGHGMARIFSCAPALANMIRGSSFEETGLPECFKLTDARLQKIRSGSISIPPGQ